MKKEGDVVLGQGLIEDFFVRDGKLNEFKFCTYFQWGLAAIWDFTLVGGTPGFHTLCINPCVLFKSAIYRKGKWWSRAEFNPPKSTSLYLYEHVMTDHTNTDLVIGIFCQVTLT
jgi:hypothetical protein